MRDEGTLASAIGTHQKLWWSPRDRVAFFVPDAAAQKQETHSMFEKISMLEAGSETFMMLMDVSKSARGDFYRKRLKITTIRRKGSRLDGLYAFYATEVDEAPHLAMKTDGEWEFWQQ